MNLCNAEIMNSEDYPGIIAIEEKVGSEVRVISVDNSFDHEFGTYRDIHYEVEDEQEVEVELEANDGLMPLCFASQLNNKVGMLEYEACFKKVDTKNDRLFVTYSIRNFIGGTKNETHV